MDPSSEPVTIFLSGNLFTIYTVLLWLEENEADLAYFLTPETGTVERESIMTLGLISF